MIHRVSSYYLVPVRPDNGTLLENRPSGGMAPNIHFTQYSDCSSICLLYILEIFWIKPVALRAGKLWVERQRLA
jgi:hypothetical protein